MSYYLSCQFGNKKQIPLSAANLRELTIVQDMNKFLPEFRMKIVDATGQLTHMLPIDDITSKIDIGFSQRSDNETQNHMTFDVYMFLPEGHQSSPAAIYDVEGLLHVSELLTNDFSRSFNGTISETVKKIAKEIGVSENFTHISPGLDYEKTLIQPYWTNIQFLRYLKERIEGINGEWGYKCFMYAYQGRTHFEFKALSEMIKNSVKYKFILSDQPYQDQYPIFNYSIFGNSKIYTSLAGRIQSYAYFDYDTEEFKDEMSDAQEYESLTDYFLIDQSGSDGSNYLNKLGRSTDFTSDFAGYVKNNYGNRLMDLAKLWITTQGLCNIVPGNVVQIFFPYADAGDNLASYQYSGYWLVERVVHNFGDHFLTKLLLTRNGIDTDVDNSLLPAAKARHGA